MDRRAIKNRLMENAGPTNTANITLLSALIPGQNITLTRSSDPPVTSVFQAYLFPMLTITTNEPIREDTLYIFSELPGLEWIVDDQYNHRTLNSVYIRLLLVLKN